MIEHKYHRITFIILIFISLLAGILSYFKIPYQFYIWEVFIDSKIIVLALLLFYFYRIKTIELSSVRLLLTNWYWKKNIIFFFLPIFIFAIVIASGLLFDKVILNRLDNSTTLILATLFDIPAIFVFSATSILIEEIFFRGFLLTTMKLLHGQIHAIILISFIWVVYSFSDFIGSEEFSLLKFGVVIIFFFANGVFCSILASKYQSLWIGYSFRLGLITLSPIIVPSLLSESDVFYSTESILFNAEGIIVSVLILVISYLIFQSIEEDKKIVEEKAEKLNFP